MKIDIKGLQELRELADKPSRQERINDKWLMSHPSLKGPIDTRQLPKLSSIQDALIDRKLIRFVEHTWPLVEPGAQFLNNWHLEAISEHLEAVMRGEIKRLIINIPPRCGKSLMTGVFFPSWAWGQDPNLKWIFSSHSASLAIRDSVKMRRLVESPWYQQRYAPHPNWSPGSGLYPGVRLERDQNAKGYYQNTATGQRLATSVGSGLTGEGADIIVVDDPHNATEALTSEAARQHAITWWSGTLSTRLNPGSRVGAKVVIMQRLHENDIVGYLLSQRDNYFRALREQEAAGIVESTETAVDETDVDWEHLCLPAEFIPKHPIVSRTRLNFVDPRTGPGTPLWAAGLPKSKIAALRMELGSYAASGQLDQLPAPKGGGILKGDWFKRVKTSDWPSQPDEVIQSWDLSYSDDPTADFTVGFTMFRVGKKIYLDKRIRRQLSFIDQIAALKALSELEPRALAKYVEKAANARALDNSLESSVSGIILLTPVGSKVKRAMAWSPYLEAGNIHVPADAPWLDEFIGECDSFPNGSFDDQVDAAGQGILQLLQQPNYNIVPDTAADVRQKWDY
jgi:predicted phage terminase large subunit-like protein